MSLRARRAWQSSTRYEHSIRIIGFSANRRLLRSEKDILTRNDILSYCHYEAAGHGSLKTGRNTPVLNIKEIPNGKNPRLESLYTLDRAGAQIEEGLDWLVADAERLITLDIEFLQKR
jgi:hypothetical protein